MQKLQNILTIVFGIAIIALYIIVFTRNKEITNFPKIEKNSLAYNYKIAFIDTDTLLKYYKLQNILEQKILNKQKYAEDKLKKMGDELEKELAAFQKKVMNNGFISQESAQYQQQELMLKEQNFYKLRDELNNEIAEEFQRLNKQLLDSVINIINIFNSDKKYDYILKKDAILYGNNAMNITDTIVFLLNKRFADNEK